MQLYQERKERIFEAFVSWMKARSMEWKHPVRHPSTTLVLLTILADLLCNSLQLFIILDYCGHFLLDYAGSLHLLIKPHVIASLSWVFLNMWFNLDVRAVLKLL